MKLKRKSTFRAKQNAQTQAIVYETPQVIPELLVTNKSKSMNSLKEKNDSDDKPTIKIMKLNTNPIEELGFLQ